MAIQARWYHGKVAFFALIFRVKRLFIIERYKRIRRYIDEEKRIVVKIGSSSLTNAKGEIDHENYKIISEH